METGVDDEVSRHNIRTSRLPKSRDIAPGL